MLNGKTLKKLATMQLQLAIIEGEKWAIEAVLGKSQELIISSGDVRPKWEVEITHVNQKEPDDS